MAENAGLSFKNCVIKCKGFDEETFIISNGNNKIKLEQSTFVDCSNFLVGKYSNNGNKLIIKQNKILNCVGCFCSLNYEDKVDFKNNLVVVDNVAHFYHSFKSKIRETMFSLRANNVYDSVFINALPLNIKENFSIEFLRTDENVVNCKFIGLCDSIYGENFDTCYFENCSNCFRNLRIHGSIDNCLFKNCTQISGNNICGGVEKIKYSQFIDCYDFLISSGFSGGLQILNCEFINTTERNNNGYNDFCIELRRSDDSDSKCNYIKSCVFRGVKLKQMFLIGSSNTEKLDSYTGRIEYCTFENCITGRSSGQIIKHYIQYTSFFREKDDYAITNENCIGLDKINRYVSNGGRVTDYQEKKVGVELTEDEVGSKLSVQI